MSLFFVQHLIDIPRQPEEYEAIYGTRPHVTFLSANETNNSTQLRFKRTWPMWPVPYTASLGK